MTEPTFRYQTPSVFRAALRERFGQIARTDRRYPLAELQRQFAYDRALARLFSSHDADRWVLKGAGALLARLATARHSKDVDVFFNATDAAVDDVLGCHRQELLDVLRTQRDLEANLGLVVGELASDQGHLEGGRLFQHALQRQRACQSIGAFDDRDGRQAELHGEGEVAVIDPGPDDDALRAGKVLVDAGNPLDFSSLGAMPDGSAARQQAIDASYGAATSRLDPQFAQREDMLVCFGPMAS